MSGSDFAASVILVTPRDTAAGTEPAGDIPVVTEFNGRQVSGDEADSIAAGWVDSRRASFSLLAGVS